jgi:hypothetical protein
MAGGSTVGQIGVLNQTCASMEGGLMRRPRQCPRCCQHGHSPPTRTAPPGLSPRSARARSALPTASLNVPQPALNLPFTSPPAACMRFRASRARRLSSAELEHHAKDGASLLLGPGTLGSPPACGGGGPAMGGGRPLPRQRIPGGLSCSGTPPPAGAPGHAHDPQQHRSHSPSHSPTAAPHPQRPPDASVAAAASRLFSGDSAMPSLRNTPTSAHAAAAYNSALCLRPRYASAGAYASAQAQQQPGRHSLQLPRLPDPFLEQPAAPPGHQPKQRPPYASAALCCASPLGRPAALAGGQLPACMAVAGSGPVDGMDGTTADLALQEDPACMADIFLQPDPHPQEAGEGEEAAAAAVTMAGWGPLVGASGGGGLDAELRQTLFSTVGHGASHGVHSGGNTGPPARARSQGGPWPVPAPCASPRHASAGGLPLGGLPLGGLPLGPAVGAPGGAAPSTGGSPQPRLPGVRGPSGLESVAAHSHPQPASWGVAPMLALAPGAGAGAGGLPPSPFNGSLPASGSTMPGSAAGGDGGAGAGVGGSLFGPRLAAAFASCPGGAAAGGGPCLGQGRGPSELQRRLSSRLSAGGVRASSPALLTDPALCPPCGPFGVPEEESEDGEGRPSRQRRGLHPMGGCGTGGGADPAADVVGLALAAAVASVSQAGLMLCEDW